MKTFLIALLFVVIISQNIYSQKYKPLIEPFPGMVKADARLILKTGYLVVPEDRNKPAGQKVKIPFLFVRRPDQDPRKNITLYTTGGPGYSTTLNIDSISYNSGWLAYGGFIAFDQRGTKRAKPCLDCMEVATAIKRSYIEGKNKDSLVLAAVRQCRNRFVKQGVNLSAYNTIESAEDINDLRLALNVDSLNLVGISYSGGLMLTMARNHPEGVRTLILTSPLPGYVNFEEHALFNINEALEQIFRDCEADSADTKYKNLRSRFHQYFTSITGKKLIVSYKEKDSDKNINVAYNKKELLDAVINRLNSRQANTVPGVMIDLIEGRQDKYVREVLDGYFTGDANVSLGMRYSVYCSEQINYADYRLEKQQDQVLPWLAGYPFNNVNHSICGCWQVKPEPAIAKQPVYSGVPALISAGDIDPDCRPFYNRLIKRYMPNSQLLIIHNKGHAPGFSVDGTDYVKLFLANPYKQLVSESKNLIVE
ncbi:alpha/beta hydrolase fold [Mucilaginibacter sp. OK268]|jgi:pimeloyl-ACP methyl ester carboxylesterase|uniref:alpha/beta fold hydrolase n=1 Tax=Mucilaginibacter sp. OK268 TaxID=1881048 RepID=UPI00088A7A46|nr:alpha/beta fold hydrolase [Mucilaginibacter sp. OK268]SDP56453.1 alpha/beta hydrolase fold [Mucilaginibacter sp. OK268]